MLLGVAQDEVGIDLPVLSRRLKAVESGKPLASLVVVVVLAQYAAIFQKAAVFQKGDLAGLALRVKIFFPILIDSLLGILGHASEVPPLGEGALVGLVGFVVGRLVVGD